MRRRHFINTSVAGTVIISAGGVFGLSSGLNSETAERIDPIVPFRFYKNRKNQMLSQMIEMKKYSGLGRFLLIGPMDETAVKGFPLNQVYAEIGELVLEVKNHLAPYDIEVGWWCAPSLRSGFHESFQYITDIDGSVSNLSVCPLDPLFREVFSDNVATVVRIARPFMVQFEDDYELSWHPPHIKFGCFCPHHLAEFSKRQNKDYSREELTEIFRTVTPESIVLRRAWAELSRDSLAGLASLIREKIDRIAPETRISLCQSGMADFDGNFTEAVAKAFAGNTRPMVRLYGSSYSSDEAVSLPEIIFHALYSRQHLPAGFECLHESDPYPHTRFFMSAAKIMSLITIALSYKLDDSLFYATQYLDNPLEEKGYADIFRKETKRLAALKEAVKGCRVTGCEIVYRPNGHFINPFRKNRPAIPWNEWVRVTGRFGIPHTSAGGNVKLISGNLVETMDDKEIRELLSGPVFLDGEAAYLLASRGWGEYLGADVAPGTRVDFCFEGVRDPDKYKNINGKLMYNLIFAPPAGTEGGSFYELMPYRGSEIITDFLDSEEQPVIPGMIRFENKLGGRVAVMAFKLGGNRSSSLFNYKKKELIRQTIEWLGKGPLPVFVNDLPNVFAICNQSLSDDYTVVTVISLNSDSFDSLSLDVAERWAAAKTEVLETDGRWKTVNAIRSGRTFRFNISVALMTPVILRFRV